MVLNRVINVCYCGITIEKVSFLSHNWFVITDPLPCLYPHALNGVHRVMFNINL